MGLVLLPGIPPTLSYWTITLFSLLMMAAASLFSILLLSAIQRYPEPGGASSFGKGYRLCTGCG